MAKLTNQSNYNTVAFGQFGSAFLDTPGTDLTCPPGKVFVAISVVERATFTKLEAVDDQVASGSFGTTGTDGDYDGHGDYVTSATAFPAGMTIYGEWDTINLQGGKIVAYWGPAN